MLAAANELTAVPVPRLVVAGTHSGSGKTTVSTGLMAAYTRLGRSVRPFKVGPDYIDPSFHRFVTGRSSSSLDAWMLSEDAVKRLFLRHAATRPEEASLSIIEGVMGLFDGQGTSWTGSTAHVATILDAPVLLVVDGQGMSLSAAALVSGYASFMPGCVPAGILFNRLSGDKHYRLLSEIVQGETGIPCFGYLSRNSDIVLQRRHLGLVPGDEVENLAHIVNLLADAMEKTVDLEGLAGLAAAAPALATPEQSVPEHAGEDEETPGNDRLEALYFEPKSPRIGVFMDNAFSFYYQDNLELLETLGAELVFISPMRDAALPEGLCGVYLGGGFPEVFAGELAANKGFRASLCKALEAGMPAYAECGGLMYLMEAIETLDGKEHPMAGFFKGRAVMTKRLGPFGYVTVELMCDSVLGSAGTTTRAHEFHHSRLESREAGEAAVSRKENGESWAGGLVKNNVLAWYPHVHFHAAPELAHNFVTACRTWKNSRHDRSGLV